MKKIPTNSLIVLVTLILSFVIGTVSSEVVAEDKDPNRFFRLTKPKSERHPPLDKDGIHDPEAEGLSTLQMPKSAFDTLSPGKSGNYVDWVQAMDKGIIKPRYSFEDPTAKPLPMDLKIVRQVKGSTPDVLFPHKPHTLWLDCSNCHPDVYIPKKGANSMSMAEIILGKGCGMCHGKVAFPISECRRCHSEPKSTALKAATVKDKAVDKTVDKK